MYGRSCSSRFLSGLWLSLGISLGNICPALAQCGTLDGYGRSVSFTEADAHPEGAAPQYFNGGTLTLSYLNGDESAGPNTTVAFDYHWQVSGSDVHFRVNAPATQQFTGGHLVDTVSMADANRAFGTGGTVDMAGGDSSGNTCSLYHTQVMPYYALGLTTVTVKDASGTDVPGAVIKMFCTAAPSASVQLNARPGQTLLGQGVYVAGDSPYPPGLNAFDYQILVTAPGYQAVYSDAVSGSGWPGHTVGFVLGPSGGSSTATITTTSGNPDTNPGSGGTGTGTGLGFPTDFWTQFVNFMKSLFIPQQETLNLLRDAAHNLSGYGPFGLPGQIATILGTLSATGTASQQDGTYWYWYFVPPTFAGTGGTGAIVSLTQPGSTIGLPLGYDPSKEPAKVIVPTMYDSLMPQYLDLTPFSDVLLLLRRLILVMGWLAFLTEILQLLIPKPGV